MSSKLTFLEARTSGDKYRLPFWITSVPSGRLSSTTKEIWIRWAHTCNLGSFLARMASTRVSHILIRRKLLSEASYRVVAGQEVSALVPAKGIAASSAAVEMMGY